MPTSTTLRRALSALLLPLALSLSSAAFAGTVSLKSSDGTALSAQHDGKGARGVVLIHGQDHTREEWAWLAPKLVAAGFQVIALDLRGHGASGGTLDEASWALMADDATAAVAYLKSKGATEVQVVGAELGASLAALVAAKDPEIQSVVMLSPALNVHGVKASSALEALNTRPVLLVASREEPTSAKLVGLLGPKLPKSQVELLDKGTGTKLFSQSPTDEPLLVGWLTGSWKTSLAPDPTRSVETGKTDDVQSSGKRLDER